MAVNESSEQVVAITKIVIHPEFDVRSNENDIAILKISPSIMFSEQVGSALLSTSSADGFVGNCDVTGWGVTTEDGLSPTKLQKFEV